MKNVFKKIINRMYITFILIGAIAPIRHVFAEFTKPFRIDEYELLAPLPTLDSPFKTGDLNNLFNYLNIIIPIFIGLCAVLAVIMIIMGGIQYMTSELISSKEEGRKRITNAIFGLLLALGAWLILYTINPDILNPDLSVMKKQTVTVIAAEPLVNSINEKTGADSARCKEAPSPCTTAELTSIFGDKAAGMSKICNMESGGQNIPSGVDKGTDGTVFSFGLFQINLLANGSVIQDSTGGSCSNLFITSSNNSPIPPSKYILDHGEGQNPRYTYDAKLKPGMEAKYASCKATLLDPVKNKQVARILFDQGASGFGDPMYAWKADKAACGSAWN